MILPNLGLSALKLHAAVPQGSTRRNFITPIPELLGEALLVLDNTSLEKIKRCHKAGQYYLIMAREPHARNAALTYGGAMHQGLEKFHTWEYKKDLVANEARALLDEQCGPAAQDAAITRYFTENSAPPDWRTLPLALEVMKHYRRRCDSMLHPDYEWDILSDPSGPIIERAFELPMAVLEGHWIIAGVSYTRIHLAWSGRIDLCVSVNGKNRISDHKTSSIDREKLVPTFTISPQVLGYIWAGQQLWPELSIMGFVLNALKCSDPKGKPILERGPRGGEGPLQFYRAYFQYTPERILRWKRDTILLIEDFLHSLSRSSFPLNDHGCFDKFGRCPYYDACTMDNEDVGDALVNSDNFKQVTWNPMDDR